MRWVLFWLMWVTAVPASACVGGFMHQWHDLPLGQASSTRVMTITHLLRILEAKLTSAPGTWGIALTDENLSPELQDSFASSVAGEGMATDDRISWAWSGCLPPFGTGDLANRIPASLTGMVWIDPLELREEPCAKYDPTFPGAIALRLGWSSRAVFRVMACRREGDVLLIDEFPIVTVFELDGLFPVALPLGGFWIRRQAWQDVGHDRPQEVMLLPPFGFGQRPSDPDRPAGVAVGGASPSGTASPPASSLPGPGR